MNPPIEQAEAMARQYLEHGSEINKLAGNTLRLETQDTAPIAAKFSIGLSLQAAELAGKAIRGESLRTKNKTNVRISL